MDSRFNAVDRRFEEMHAALLGAERGGHSGDVVGRVAKAGADQARAAIDAAEKAMADPRLAAFMDPKKLPFDGKRMFFGGFKVLVEA